VKGSQRGVKGRGDGRAPDIGAASSLRVLSGLPKESYLEERYEESVEVHALDCPGGNIGWVCESQQTDGRVLR
jgi:hypothetical protein